MAINTSRHTGSVGLAGAAAVVGRLRVALVQRRRVIGTRMDIGYLIIGRRLVGDAGIGRLVGSVREVVRVGWGRVGHGDLLQRWGRLKRSATGFSPVHLCRRIIAAIEPWYDWGWINTFRLDAKEPDFSDECEGEVRFVELQWLGVYLCIQIGRTPKRRA